MSSTVCSNLVEDSSCAAQNIPPRQLTVIIDDIASEIRRHVILDQHLAETIALWIIYAHGSDTYRYSPRLSVRSPVHACGKTTLLAVITALCGKRAKMVSNLTIAAYFRCVDAASQDGATPPIMIIDEVDTFLAEDRKEVFGILNSGHDREGARILRCLNSEANHEAREYSTYAPLVLGGIGGFGEGAHAAALESRCLVINLRRKRPDERVEKFLEEAKTRCARLAGEAAKWCAQNIQSLREAEPEMIPGLYDRAQDNWSALFAIADAAGDKWGKRARDAAAFLNGEAEDPSESVMLLRDIREIFEERDRIATSDLLDRLHQREERPWGMPVASGFHPWGPRQLGRILTSFRIQSQTVKIAGAPVRGFYRHQFEPAWASYLPYEPGLAPEVAQ